MSMISTFLFHFILFAKVLKDNLIMISTISLVKFIVFKVQS